MDDVTNSAYRPALDIPGGLGTGPIAMLNVTTGGSVGACGKGGGHGDKL